MWSFAQDLQKGMVLVLRIQYIFYEVVQIRILKFAKVPIRSLFIIMCVKLLSYINEIV